MTVAILSDAPTLTTGFARTTARIAASLAEHHVVHCYGIKATPDDVAVPLPYHVWPAQQGGHWSDLLGDFFASCRPDVLLLNMDAKNAVECVQLCRAVGIEAPVVSYVCFDGLPVGRRCLEVQRSCASVWATSEPGAAFLTARGVVVAGVAPPGVDPGEFRPLSNRKVIRRTIGLGDCFLVGVFASNTERKQLPRAIAGFAAAAGALPGLDLRLYLHCRWDGYWDVAELVERHGIADRMIGPGSSAHSEARGVPLDTWNASLGDLHDLGYAARLAVCDLIVNTPFSGDVEQVILEANSCGVALLHTDDDGIMAAAAGDAAVLLPAADVGTGPLGEARHHVDPRRVGQQIAWLAADEGARSALARRGLSNAARFPWSTLERAALEMVAPYAERSTGP